MKRTIGQREAYALQRMGKSIDRIIRTESKEEKTQASKWTKAWTDRHAGFLAARKATD